MVEPRWESGDTEPNRESTPEGASRVEAGDEGSDGAEPNRESTPGRVARVEAGSSGSSDATGHRFAGGDSNSPDRASGAAAEGENDAVRRSKDANCGVSKAASMLIGWAAAGGADTDDSKARRKAGADPDAPIIARWRSQKHRLKINKLERRERHTLRRTI